MRTTGWNRKDGWRAVVLGAVLSVAGAAQGVQQMLAPAGKPLNRAPQYVWSRLTAAQLRVVAHDYQRNLQRGPRAVRRLSIQYVRWERRHLYVRDDDGRISR